MRVSLFNLYFVVIVLCFIALDLLRCIPLGFVERDVEVLDLLSEFLLVKFPLSLIFLVPGGQFLDLVFLNLHSGILMFFLGREVELHVLRFAELFL